MNENFERLKKAYFLRVAALSAICGVLFGTFVAGALLLAIKLTGIKMGIWVYPVVGLGVALVVAALVFLCVRPGEKKFAKKLDEEFALGERVQTMVSYRDQESAMLTLQREDTENKLSSLPKKKTPVGQIVKGCVAGVLAVAMLVSAIVVPSKKVDAGPVEPPPEEFVINEWQIAALEQLINDVDGSALELSPKKSAVATLSALLQMFKDVGVTNVVIMKASVLSAISGVDLALVGQNSYLPIDAKFDNFDDVKTLSATVRAGVNLYKLSGVKISTMDYVTRYAAEVESAITTRMKIRLADARNLFNGLTGEGLSTALTTFADHIDLSLKGSGVEATDGLYETFTVLSDSVKELAGKTEGYNDTYLALQLDNIFNDKYIQKLAVPLNEQIYNCMMDDFVRNRLAEIFSLASEELPDKIDNETNISDNVSGGSSDNDGTEPDDTLHDGGIGGGNLILGSTDKIYDPDLEAYVIYGEVINNYYGKVTELFRGGNVTEEQELAISQYYEILFSGLKTEENPDKN